MIDRYELYPDPIETDEGDDYINIESIKDDQGDWCKAEDVDVLVAENERLEQENDRLNALVLELQNALRARA